MKKKCGRLIAGAAARSAGYILAGLSAIFLAVALSVLFAVACASEDIGEAGVSEGDFLIIWKPAYLFSVPAEGDLVLFRPEETFSGEASSPDCSLYGIRDGYGSGERKGYLQDSGLLKPENPEGRKTGRRKSVISADL